MTVYVDDAQRRLDGIIMSHLIGDNVSELHAFARGLGLHSHWYDRDHYDICQSKKAEAIELGAVAITKREAAEMMHNVRRGLPMGTPEDARRTMAAEWTRRGMSPPDHLLSQGKLDI